MPFIALLLYFLLSVSRMVAEPLSALVAHVRTILAGFLIATSRASREVVASNTRNFGSCVAAGALPAFTGIFGGDNQPAVSCVTAAARHCVQIIVGKLARLGI